MSGMARKAGIVLLLILVLLCLGRIGTRLFRAARSQGAVTEWQLIPDDGGTIGKVVCVANSARRAVLRNAGLITHIVNALPPSAKVVILTNDPSAFYVARNSLPHRVRFLDLPENSDFTIWPQDPFLVLKNPDGRYRLLVSRTFERADDRLIPQYLAKDLNADLQTSDLCFEGGNIVSGARHVFIGANTIRVNALDLKIPETDVVIKFQAELGRPVVVLGPVPQPVGHIDMVVTPIGDGRLLLADPGWGARLARGQLRDHPDLVRSFEQRCEENFFGDRRIGVLKTPGGQTIEHPPVIGQTVKAVEDSQDIADELDKLASELSRWNYQVHRVPFLFRREPPPSTSPATTSPTTTKPLPPKPDYPCLTYNNVLLEVLPDRQTVYLPQYGWDVLDRTACEVWENLGYRVVPVRDFSISAMYGGSLRCCTKVLGRD